MRCVRLASPAFALTRLRCCDIDDQAAQHTVQAGKVSSRDCAVRKYIRLRAVSSTAALYVSNLGVISVVSELSLTDVIADGGYEGGGNAPWL